MEKAGVKKNHTYDILFIYITYTHIIALVILIWKQTINIYLYPV